MKQAIVLIAFVLVLAACGGGSGRLSRADFVAKANAICDKYRTMINAVPQPKTASDIPPYIDKVLPMLKEGTSKLNALKPPSDLQGTADAWRQLLNKAIDQANALEAAAKKGDLAGVTRIANEASADNKRGNQLAGQLGAQSCAKD